MKESCAPIRDLLPLYAEGKAAPETRAFIERHLSECPECQHRFSELRSVDPRARREAPLASRGYRSSLRLRRGLSVWLSA